MLSFQILFSSHTHVMPYISFEEPCWLATYNQSYNGLFVLHEVLIIFEFPFQYLLGGINKQ